jgi:beta-lactam-binding protein with PASTA domain
MPKFKSVDAFYSWANKYGINYEEIHEFSSTVPAGEVISYSYKKGQAIKNNDTIKVTISDGNKKEVPNLKGLSKSEAIKKLDNAGLKYAFIYDSSNTVKKNYVIRQSISAGSEISDGITITVTLSNGEKESSSTNQRKANVETNTNNNSGNNGGNSGGNSNPTPQSTPEPEPVKPSCNQCTITGLKNIIRDNLNGGYNSVASALRSSIQSQCPGITVNIGADSTSGKAPGSFVSGFSGGSTDSCKTVSITLAN